METQACTTLDEKQRITDLLSSEKYMTGAYNTFCCEASTGAVKSCLNSLLQDEHRIHEEIFDTMNARGWYPMETAEETKINAAKQKFSQNVSV